MPAKSTLKPAEKAEALRLMSMFCDRTEVAAAMGFSRDDLARYVENTFGRPYAEVEAEQYARGRASLKEGLFEVANGEKADTGRMKALDMLGRRYLDLDRRDSVRAKAPAPPAMDLASLPDEGGEG